VEDAHDEAVGLEWGPVRGYSVKNLKAILKHKLAGRPDARLRACLLRPALGIVLLLLFTIIIYYYYYYYYSSYYFIRYFVGYVLPPIWKRADMAAALAAARLRDDLADCSDEELCESFCVADLSGLDFTSGVRFSGKFIVDDCESWSKGTATGCSCVDGKHVLDVVWDETPGEVATCSIGDQDDELVLLQRMKPQARLTRKDPRPAVLLSSGQDVTLMATPDLGGLLLTLRQGTGQADSEQDDIDGEDGEDAGGEDTGEEGSPVSRTTSEASIMDLTGQGRAASDVSMQAASL
jgi:hypothetical protein